MDAAAGELAITSGEKPVITEGPPKVERDSNEG
jgi:hypothetical protein